MRQCFYRLFDLFVLWFQHIFFNSPWLSGGFAVFFDVFCLVARIDGRSFEMAQDSKCQSGMHAKVFSTATAWVILVSQFADEPTS